MFNDSCNIVVSAPTSCGKTVMFELAIVSMLQRRARQGQRPQTVVYLAPLKALCQERMSDWKAKFPHLTMCELTSDGADDEWGVSLRNVDLVFATPEKIDSVTRKWRDHKAALREFGLFLVDEVHLLHDARGATLEACISRMATLGALPEFADSSLAKLRILALSATIPNIADIAQWLRAPPHATLVFGNEYRPVQVDVKCFSYDDGKNDFLFDRNLNYRLFEVVRQHSRDRPTLIFCTTRNMTEQAAQQLVKDVQSTMPPRSFVTSAAQGARLAAAAGKLSDKALAACIVHGVGFHSAGLTAADRRTVEQCFAARDILVLCTTRTLAQGVNLPAHLVVIKSTMCWQDVLGQYVPYSPLDVLQMIGRAGRPQFDREATAIIMCRHSDKRQWQTLATGSGVIESTMLGALAEHLNAEVSSGTIAALPDALQWLKSTYMWVRVTKNPTHYGIAAGLTANKLEQLLQKLCLTTLTELAEHGIVTIDADTYAIAPTELGHLMSKYYLAFATMQRFNALPATAGIEAVLDALVGASELREIALRRGDKKELNAVNKQLRFPRDGKINEREQKLHCLVQATLDGHKFEQWTLNNEAKTVFNHITRIVRCLAETVAAKAAFVAMTSTLQLVAACKHRMWHDSEHVTRQLPHIGDVMSAALASAGVTSLRALAALDARRIEAIVGRRPPFGDEVHRSLAAVPCYVVKLEHTAAGGTQATVNVTVNRTNFADAGGRASRYPDVALVVGDTATNRVLLFKKFQSSRTNVTFSVTVSYPQTYLTARVALLDYVGQDVETETIVRYPNRIPPQRTVATTVAAAAKNAAPAKRRLDAKQCKHTCADKRSCAHRCCKVGLGEQQTGGGGASLPPAKVARIATSFDNGGISDDQLLESMAIADTVAQPPRMIDLTDESSARDPLSLLRNKSAPIVNATPARRIAPPPTSGVRSGIVPMPMPTRATQQPQLKVVRIYRPPVASNGDMSTASTAQEASKTASTAVAAVTTAATTVENIQPQRTQDVFDDIFGGLF